MMRRSTAFALLISANVTALLLVTWQGLQACGPGFEPSTFVSKKSPDDVAAFARGRLGLLQARFDSSDYAVAFRYLNGGTLSAAEQAIYAPPSTVMRDLRNLTPEQVAAVQKADREATTNASGPGAWMLERAKYSPTLAPNTPQPSFPTDYQGNYAYDPAYLNCPDAAFRNAALTLRARAGVWGANSPLIAEWITGQDAVFQQCTASSPMPATVAPNRPALLRADRTYQIAAWKFYAKEFDAAAQAFQAIARDQTSPWKTWGEYLAARSLVRKAFALGSKTEPYSDDLATFDLTTMQQAQQILELALRQTNPAPSRSALEQELNFIRLRTEPEKRLTEICAALAGPTPDANFSNDLADLQFVLIKRIKFSDRGRALNPSATSGFNL
jgi:hypothetical protein